MIGLVAALAAAGPHIAVAANTGCVVGGTTANCTDVPSDGISYTNSVDTVNVTDGNAGTTLVDPGVVGVFLKKSGLNAADAPAEIEYSVAQIDPDGDGGAAPFYAVVDGSSNPIDGDPVAGGIQYVRRTGTDPNYVYTIDGSATNYTGDQLAAHLAQVSVDAGGTVSGSLTVNNPGPNPGSGAPFSTTNADGIHVESLGGKGGNGGCTTILLATWCDDGDNGGNAGSVAVNSNSAITVNGTGTGISAVSIGGAGGNGGGAFGLFASDAGAGGDGGNGADVVVILGSNSNIETYGSGGHGVFAQSLGGNGGSGGDPSGAVALGDAGGNGGDAGAVTVTNDGSITTHGNKAYGIFAQSMGAGAGAGGGGGGIVAIGGNGGGESSGNKVTVNNTGTIQTGGLDAFGVFAQSIGGGGGDGGSAGGLIAVGGTAGSGGNGDLVKVNNSGSITTALDGSVAIFAQSIGGGGGNGGGAVGVGFGGSVAIGGSGGPGGDGGQVIINETADINSLGDATIATGGDRAHGIQAQSVGGGGGNGGFAYSGTLPGPYGISASFALGGSGGDGGDSAAVTVNEKGSITTGGDLAIGIFAQSTQELQATL